MVSLNCLLRKWQNKRPSHYSFQSFVHGRKKQSTQDITICIKYKTKLNTQTHKISISNSPPYLHQQFLPCVWSLGSNSYNRVLQCYKEQCNTKDTNTLAQVLSLLHTNHWNNYWPLFSRQVDIQFKENARLIYMPYFFQNSSDKQIYYLPFSPLLICTECWPLF